MSVGAQQAAIIRNFVDQGRYADGYRYVADRVRGNPTWNTNLAGWFDAAANINGGSAENLTRRWVYTSNAIAAGKDPTSPDTERWNQNASDELARLVLADAAAAFETGSSLTPEYLFNVDVVGATTMLGLSPEEWAGGPIGPLIYDFPTVLDTVPEI